MSIHARSISSITIFACLTSLTLAQVSCYNDELECITDSECDEGMRCNADTNECEVKPACTVNADCPGAEQCFPGEGDTGALCRLPETCTEADDANAYCRQKQNAMGEEMYSCHTQNDTCVLESQSCLSDTACVDPALPGLRCLPADDSADAKSVCRLPIDCSEAADALTFCQKAAGDEKNYMCIPSEIDPKRYICAGEAPSMEAGGYIYIQDVTVTDCDLPEDPNGFDPGSDLTFVELQDFEKMTIGWGKTVRYFRGEGMNDFTESRILDGMEPDLITTGEQEDIDNRCPRDTGRGRFNATSILTLGCGGGVLVNFPNGEDLWPIMTGHQVVVGEYAPVCNASVGGQTQSSDRYEIYLCPEREGGEPTDIECVMQGVKLSQGTESGLATVIVD